VLPFYSNYRTFLANYIVVLRWTSFSRPTAFLSYLPTLRMCISFLLGTTVMAGSQGPRMAEMLSDLPETIRRGQRILRAKSC